MNAEDVQINIDELEKAKKINAQQRLEFVKMHADWMKKTPNSVWSKQQNMLIDSQIKSTVKKHGASRN